MERDGTATIERMKSRVYLILEITAALAACSLAPPYHRPETATAPAEYQELQGWRLATPSDTEARGPWWTVFQDTTLDALESQVKDANQDLKAAYARLQEARAQTRIARAGQLPNATADASVNRTKASVDSPTYDSRDPAEYSDSIAGVTLSYEIDIFGRVRNTIAGARATEQATAGDVAALDLNLRADLAEDYFALRGLDAQQELLDRTVADYRRALGLNEALYRGGMAANADVLQARAQLESARTAAEDSILQRAQIEHAIATLVGQQASSFKLTPQPLPPNLAPPPIDLGLPSQLLERRPDVAAAERRVAAANALIGVARAAFFPVFSLAGSAGTESYSLANWMLAPSRYWSIGPQGVLPLFDGGLRRAQSASVVAAYDEQVAAYRATVLTAFQEVEDNLAALRQLEQESSSQAAAVAATKGALDQANHRYRSGLVTYLEVVSTENAALAARITAINIDTRRLTASVLLIRALGGDWNRPTADLREISNGRVQIQDDGALSGQDSITAKQIAATDSRSSKDD
jgi:NodT family efflux transporter outer membrane factor (OMF) lipoprotein